MKGANNNVGKCVALFCSTAGIAEVLSAEADRGTKPFALAHAL